MLSIGSFVCAAYSPKGINIKKILRSCQLRWHLFCEHRAESDKLPPTPGALKQHILRVHVQTRAWAPAAIAQQDPQLDPLQNGYCKQMDELLKPRTTEVLPAPKAILEMVQCRCKTDSGRCSCKANYLACTYMCRCSSQCENDGDSQALIDDSGDDDDA